MCKHVDRKTKMKGGIYMKKQGFTLAEVLIVLVILGVIAAMTVPSLMNSSNQQIYLTGLQKAYSTLNNAIQLASIEQGETPVKKDEKQFIDDVLAPVLKVASKDKDKGTGTGPTAGKEYVQTQDGVRIYVVNSPNKANGCNDIPADISKVQASTACHTIIVDVNGEKGPNKLTGSVIKGKLGDQFFLYVYRNGVTGGQNAAGYLIMNGMVKSYDGDMTASTN